MEQCRKLSDEELEGVAGGFENGESFIVGCERFICRKDERYASVEGHRRVCDVCGTIAACDMCYFGEPSGFLWVCGRERFFKRKKK